MPERRFAFSAIVWLTWLGAFLALEIPAVLERTPWEPLSDFTWGIEDHWRPFRLLVLFGLALLGVHLWQRPVRDVATAVIGRR